METITLDQVEAAPPIVQTKLPRFAIHAGGPLTLEGICYGPPDSDSEGHAVWAGLIESLHSANDLSRLARALAA
jgi:hypothetical protein